VRLGDLETEMRALEVYHGQQVLAGAWAIIRVDGRSFSKLTEERFEKPLDPEFSQLMRLTAEALVTEFDAVYGYTESDEISIVLPPSFDMFHRRVEKLVSVSAGLASATFTQEHGDVGHFDSRVWVGVTLQQVIDYLSWRMADAARCALNGYVYWTLRRDGMTARSATHSMIHQTKTLKHDTLHEHGINFNDLPRWQRRGVGFVWASVPHTGVNPRTGMSVKTTRRRLVTLDELTMGDEYRESLQVLLEPHVA
jgi:tRNA(His) 5'-end guanylyltransferase